MTMMRWYAQDEVNQGESEKNKVDGMEYKQFGKNDKQIISFELLP